MTATRYATGVVLLLVTLGPLVVAGARLRRRYLPGWRGAPAVLVQIVVALSLLILVEQLFGTVALFRREVIPPACAIVGVVVAAIARPRRPQQPADADPPPADRVGVVAAVAISAVLAAQWTIHSAIALSGGITDVDSLDYHLPHAARFVQDHSLWHLHYAAPGFPSMLHPDNVELLHATGMLAFGRDLASPMLNVGWLGFALLAGWCVGRPFGKGALTLLGTAIVLATPILSATQGGSALTDVASLGLLLASIALLLQSHGGRARLVAAGTAAGLGLGTKLTLLVPVLALTIGVVVLAKRGMRGRALLDWGLPMLATGGYWFGRNLAATGSPLSSVRVPFLPVAHFALVDQTGYTVADYFRDGTVWRDWFLPGVKIAMGGWWWAILIAAAAGIVAACWGGATTRVLAATAVATVAVYVFTPTTAGGPRGAPGFFALNLRYLFPALLIGLVLLPLAPLVNSGARPVGLLVAYLVVFAITILGGGDLPGFPGVLDAWPHAHRRAAFAAAALVVGAAVLFRRPRSRGVVWAGAVAVALVAIGIGWRVQHTYFGERWKEQQLYRWADGLHGRRVGLQGSNLKYPLYGRTLTNRVQYVGTVGLHGEFHDVQSCTEWRRRLTQGRYHYVVVVQDAPGATGVEAWTRADPTATELFRTGKQIVFTLDGPSRPARC